MTHSIHIPFHGTPVRHLPQFEHEFARSGLRVLALPPGPAEVAYFMKPLIIDVNLNPVSHDLAVNSDRIRTQTVPADSVSWGPPDTELRLRTTNIDWGLVMEFDPDHVTALASERLETGGIPTDFVDYRPAPQTARLGRQLISHLRFGIPDRLFVEGMSIAIFATALTTAQLAGQAPSLANTDPRIDRAIDYIEANLAEDLSIAAIANVAGMSPSWFQSAFRAFTGQPVFAYVRARRLERARLLLAGPRLSLSQIAFACGFSSHSHMSRLFRARFGASPSEMR